MTGRRSRVLCVLGTRPEAIKLAPVIGELKQRSDRVWCKVCATAQHRHMLDQVLDLFGIEPDHDLDIMKDDQDLTQVTVSALTGLEPVIKDEKPDWVLVQGDTTTTMAASLAAFWQQVKIAHVEAGLRTHQKYRPFPEEINRRITSVVADLHFAPTAWAKRNLMREGVPEEQILVTGNPVIDALMEVAAYPEESMSTPLVNLPLRGKRLLLVTAHRRENFGAALDEICLALRDIAYRYEDDVYIVYPVHLNPRVQEPVHRILSNVDNVVLTHPLDYRDFTWLLKRSCLVLTDSGGLQEEAPSLGKPVLVLRDVTERPEAVEAGTVRLVGTSRERIVSETSRLLDDSGEYERMAHAVNPYGDGRAAHRIVCALLGEPVEPFEQNETR